MLEKQEAWKIEDGFDRIDIIAEIYEQALRRLHAGFDSKPRYTGFYIPRWLPNSKEFTMEMNVEVEILKLEIRFSQLPPPPQYDLSPRRSPMARTGLDEPRGPYDELQQAEQEGSFHFEAYFDGFLHVDCINIPEQKRTKLSSQADVGANHEEKTTAQVATHEEFEKLPIGRQQ